MKGCEMTKDETLKMALDFLMTRHIVYARAVIEALNEALAKPVQEQQQVGPVEDMLLRRAVLRSAKIVSDGRFVTKQAALEQPPLPVQPEPLEYWNAVEGWVKIESQGELK